MKRAIYLFFLSSFIIFILINSYEIMDSIRFSFSLCINNLFPSLIPFMLLSNILLKYNFVDDLSSIFNNIMEKLFKVNKNCSFVLIMSILSGSPSNAKYLKDLHENNLISNQDIQKCLNFCHFTNPIFVIGTIGYNFLNNKKIGLIILICHYLSNLIIGIFNNNSKQTNNYNKKKTIQNKNNFIEILKSSIIDTTNTLLLILGIITTCIIITCIIDNILLIKDNYKFIYGFFEITQGLKYLALTNINIIYKSIISAFLISFGGICIHLQVYSILDNKKIKYYPYFFSRILHGLLSALLTYFTIIIFN